MTRLYDHLQVQQDLASQLTGVIAAIEALHRNDVGQEVLPELISMAHNMAENLSRNLDVVALPGRTEG